MQALLATAAFLGITHTLIGVDHYIPFIVLGKSNNWTVKKALSITALCGAGHILSSVLLGFAGIALSVGLSKLDVVQGKLEAIQNTREDLALWFLIIFGLIYMAYGIYKAVKNKPHTHILPGGNVIAHTHSHGEEEHIHKKSKISSNAAWGLFILFVLGPCSPMIPIIMYPVLAESGTLSMIPPVLTYAAFTIITMLLATFIGLKGLQMVKIKKLERYTHVLAGFAVLACGLAAKIFSI